MDQTRADRRRSAILTTAARIFAEKGYHAAAIADIAAALKMGHGTFYRYFASKLDIFGAIVGQVIEQVQQAIATEDPHATDTLEAYRAQVVRLGHALFRLFEENEHLARLLFLEAPGVDAEQQARIQQMNELFGQYTEAYVANGIEKGFLRADLDRQATALAMNAIVLEGLRRLAVASDRHVESERWIAAFDRLVFDGIARAHS